MRHFLALLILLAGGMLSGMRPALLPLHTLPSTESLTFLRNEHASFEIGPEGLSLRADRIGMSCLVKLIRFEQAWVDICAENAANARTMKTADGTCYRRKCVALDADGEFRVFIDARPRRRVFDPTNPNSEKEGVDGFVYEPNVDVDEENALSLVHKRMGAVYRTALEAGDPAVVASFDGPVARYSGGELKIRCGLDDSTRALLRRHHARFHEYADGFTLRTDAAGRASLKALVNYYELGAQVCLENLGHVGDVGGSVYRRRSAVLDAQGRLCVEYDNGDFRWVYDPTHKAAVKEGAHAGYVACPNINLASELSMLAWHQTAFGLFRRALAKMS